MSLSLFLPRDLLQAHQLVQGGVPLEGQSPLGGQEVDSDKGEFGDAHMQTSLGTSLVPRLPTNTHSQPSPISLPPDVPPLKGPVHE